MNFIFAKKKLLSNQLSFILQTFYPVRSHILIAFLFTAGYGAIDAYLISFLQTLLDGGMMLAENTAIRLLIIKVTLFMCLRASLSFFANFLKDFSKLVACSELRKTLTSQVIDAQYHVLSQKESGSVLNDLDSSTARMTEKSCEVFSACVKESASALGMLCVMYAIAPGLTITYFSTCIPCLVVMSYLGKKAKALTSAGQQSKGLFFNRFSVVYQAIIPVKIFGAQDYEKKQLAQLLNQHVGIEIKNSFYSSMIGACIQLISGLAFSGLLAWLLMTASGKLSTGEFGSFLGALVALLNPIRQLSKVRGEWAQACGTADELLKIASWPQEENQGTDCDQAACSVVPILSPLQLSLKGVSFSYPGTQHLVLDNLSLDLQAGQWSLLTGGSGEGKTTLISLLVKFRNPLQGEITLNGQNIKTWPGFDYRSRFISLATQKPLLSHGTIASNIAYPQESIEPQMLQKIQYAAELAGIHEYIMGQPYQYDTIVGGQKQEGRETSADCGGGFSGGQQQRLSLARAFYKVLYKGAGLLLLDEPTSALDKDCKQIICSSLDKLAHENHVTILVISHDKELIKYAQKHDQRVLELKDGQIIEGNVMEAAVRKDIVTNCDPCLDTQSLIPPPPPMQINLCLSPTEKKDAASLNQDTSSENDFSKEGLRQRIVTCSGAAL